MIGSALAARNLNRVSWKAIFITLFFVGLAISPDIDYIVFWLFNIQIEPRLTHSIGYCLMVGAMAVGIKRFLLKDVFRAIPSALFFGASFSHLILDILVGVHPMPLFWPVDSHLIVLPFGVLPSAGHIDLHNFYFWRNLLIELGILIPVAAAFVPRYRKALMREHKVIGICFFGVFAISCLMGFNLQR